MGSTFMIIASLSKICRIYGQDGWMEKAEIGYQRSEVRKGQQPDGGELGWMI